MLWEEDSHIKKYMKLQHKIFFSYWKLILDEVVSKLTQPHL